MTIGQQPTRASLDAEITSAANNWRAAAIAGQQVAQKLLKHQADLARLGYDPGEVAAATDFAGNLNNLSGVFFGTATQGAAFDYDDKFADKYGA